MQNKPTSPPLSPQVPGDPPRKCGSCSLCCKVLHVVELHKPPGKWCLHCAPGKGGCLIYADRPPSCEAFDCGWLRGAGPEEERPDKIGLVILGNRPEGLFCAVALGPTLDGPVPAWFGTATGAGLRSLVRRGMPVFITAGATVYRLGLNRQPGGGWELVADLESEAAP